MSWFKKDKPGAEKGGQPEDGERKVRTEGLWQKCDGCRQIIWKRDLENNSSVCPKCNFHFRVDAAARREQIVYVRIDPAGWWRMEGDASALAETLAVGRIDPIFPTPVTLVVSPLGSCAFDVRSGAAAAVVGLEPLTCELRAP